MTWSRRVGFYLLAQPADVDRHRRRVAIGEAPDVGEQLLAPEGSAWVAHEVGEKVEGDWATTVADIGGAHGVLVVVPEPNLHAEAPCECVDERRDRTVANAFDRLLDTTDLHFRGDAILVFEVVDEVKGVTGYRPPGGTIEFGERSEDAVIREIREELSAELTDVRPLGTLENIFRFRGEASHEIIVVYQGRLADATFYDRETIDGVEANGEPLSVRIILGRPYLRNTSVKAPLAPSASMRWNPSQPRMKRLNWSVTVSG